MRYRQLSPTGDYVFGKAVWLTNSPQAVAQAIKTRLKLWAGEWFADTSDGTQYPTQVLGERHGLPPNPVVKTPDAVFKARILGTPGVTQLLSYSTEFNAPTDTTPRTLVVNATVSTLYSVTPISVSLPLQVAVP